MIPATKEPTDEIQRLARLFPDAQHGYGPSPVVLTAAGRPLHDANWYTGLPGHFLRDLEDFRRYRPLGMVQIADSFARLLNYLQQCLPGSLRLHRLHGREGRHA